MNNNKNSKLVPLLFTSLLYMLLAGFIASILFAGFIGVIPHTSAFYALIVCSVVLNIILSVGFTVSWSGLFFLIKFYSPAPYSTLSSYKRSLSLVVFPVSFLWAFIWYILEDVPTETFYLVGYTYCYGYACMLIYILNFTNRIKKSEKSVTVSM